MGKNTPNTSGKPNLSSTEKRSRSGAGIQHRFLIFLLITLGIYTLLLKVFQKLAEIVQLAVFFPIALITLLLFIGIIGVLYSRTFVGPLARIRRALDQMSEGDTSVSLRLRESDDPLLKDLVNTITLLCENNRNAQGLTRDAAAVLREDIAALREKVHGGADTAEVKKLLEEVHRKQDALEKALRPCSTEKVRN
jgi:nitrogen fixation/metabolism regulation signal transduction histidine kinase